ncbi:hypothetical protein [Leifsonia soli]|uniref:Uncharacterized protein n=1 Tax=Leifsonia soli TaxID=582665 RepID=A0A852T105_9MICO|nr:hypothetical protein [Leifsonia soli]NYD75228.1 hypothetical protein [Leifsonia soli]
MCDDDADAQKPFNQFRRVQGGKLAGEFRHSGSGSESLEDSPNGGMVREPKEGAIPDDVQAVAEIAPSDPRSKPELFAQFGFFPPTQVVVVVDVHSEKSMVYVSGAGPIMSNSSFSNAECGVIATVVEFI